MSDSLSIQPAAAASPVPPAAPVAASAEASSAATKTTLPDLPNPSMHLDPQLGMVVLEFHSSTGQVTNTLPTQQQLDAYRAFGVPQAGGDAGKARTTA